MVCISFTKGEYVCEKNPFALCAAPFLCLGVEPSYRADIEMIVSLRQARVLTYALTEIDYIHHLKRYNTDCCT
jgi:hypothetical protein